MTESLPGSTEVLRRPRIYHASRRERLAGAGIFLAVTGCWMLGLASWELGWVEYQDSHVLIAAVLSVVTVVLTGFICELKDAAWLGWIPGAAMIAIGFSMTPTVGGDETGGTLVFFGGLVLALGWPFYFLPLIALGVVLRRRRERRLTPATT